MDVTKNEENEKRGCCAGNLKPIYRIREIKELAKLVTDKRVTKNALRMLSDRASKFLLHLAILSDSNSKTGNVTEDDVLRTLNDFPDYRVIKKYMEEFENQDFC